MTNVITLDAAVPEDGARAPRRLKILSRGLAWLFTLLLGLMALNLGAAFVICLFFPGYVLMTSGSAALAIGEGGGLPSLPPGMTRLSDLPFITHLAGIADIAVMLLPAFFILWHLRGLFRLYAAGVVFARRNALHLKHVGLWLIALPACRFAANMLFRAAGGTDQTWFRPDLLWIPLAGLIIVAIAWVMAFGRDIEEEKDSFI